MAGRGNRGAGWRAALSVLSAVALSCGILTAVVGLAVSTASSAWATPVATTFVYTGALQAYVVPDGVTNVVVEVWGSRAFGFEGDGGAGGYAKGTVGVTPGETLYVGVGDGDGGAADVRQGGDTLADRIVVAGGGGDAGSVWVEQWCNDGQPHGDFWDCSYWAPVKGGDGGGPQGSAGADGSGGGGTATAGGYSQCVAGVGSFGFGGAGCDGGGDGGDGWYGGGGGGAGGGGSGYVTPAAVDVVNASGLNYGGARATITPADVAYAPGSPSAVQGDAQATVSWTPPTNDGGFAVSGYVVTPYLSGVAQTPVAYGSTATTEAVSGLTNGQTYTFTVSATNALGTGPESGASAPVPIGIADSPGSLSAVTGDGQATVSWTPPTNDGGFAVSGYVVTPYLSGIAQTPVAYGSTATTEVVTGLTNAQTYTFTVSATNATGTGSESVASAPVTIGIPTAPQSPSAVAGNAQASVSWVAPVSSNGSAIIGYGVNVYVGGVLQSQWVFDSPATNAIVTGLTNGTAYTFTVSATNANGTGPQSVASPPIIVGTPTAPRSPSAVPGNGSATVSWVAPVSNNGTTITAYLVTAYWNGTLIRTTQYNSTATTQTMSSLVNGKTYTFRVAARNAKGTGPQSVSTLPTTIGTPSAPGSPSAVSGNAQSAVSWSAPNDGGSPITGYTVTPYVGGVAQPAVVFNSTATTEVVTGLTNGKSYTFKVAANNARGSGSQSVATAPTTIGIPSAPRSPVAAPRNAAASVSWTVPSTNNGSSITGYIITPYLAGVAQTPRVFNSTATSQLITSLTNGKTYTFKVAAKNARGTGPQSVATTPITAGTPTAPTAVTATAGVSSATVHWTAPSTANGSAIVSYIVTPYIGNVAQAPWVFSATATTRTITGLTSGTTYTFKVAAKNGTGTGPQSVPSNAVTPA